MVCLVVAVCLLYRGWGSVGRSCSQAAAPKHSKRRVYKAKACRGAAGGLPKGPMLCPARGYTCMMYMVLSSRNTIITGCWQGGRLTWAGPICGAARTRQLCALHSILCLPMDVRRLPGAAIVQLCKQARLDQSWLTLAVACSMCVQCGLDGWLLHSDWLIGAVHVVTVVVHACSSGLLQQRPCQCVVLVEALHRGMSRINGIIIW
jgi:hypothetical protein